MKTNIVKQRGQVFTPIFIVELMLDFCEYQNDKILRKHIIDNSCGDGAFLCVIVKRYAEIFLKKSQDKSLLKKELESFIHGIEIEQDAYKNCLLNLDAIASTFGLANVNWDVRFSDALENNDFNEKMDFVVGNPPYVRVHNLENNYCSVKRFSFANGGMTDLFLAFYELGFRMMKKNSGKLCYITPNSWFNSLAATNMRTYIQSKQTLVGLIDFGHQQLFDGVTSYVAVSFFDNTVQSEKFSFYSYDATKNAPLFVDYLSFREISIDGYFYLGRRKDLTLLKNIKKNIYRQFVSVKNGYATLADNIFISKDLPFSEHTIPVLKGSTGKWSRAFFPYDNKGKPLPKKVLFSNIQIAAYMNQHKEVLLKGKTEADFPEWYLYGRNQALKDTFCDKIGINSLVKDISSIKLQKVPTGSGLYSGLYIQTNVDFEHIEKVVKNEDFINYLKVLKKYKSGGYYTYNSKDLEQYLNYKLSIDEFIHQQYRQIGQPTLSFGYPQFV